MKKVVSLLLACALCLGLLAGCQGQGGPEPFTVEDFYAYDENGNILEKEPGVYFKPEWHLKRRVSVGDDASKLIQEYPVDNAEVFSDAKVIESYYNSNIDRIQHSGEADDFLTVYILFYEDLSGNLYTNQDVEEGRIDKNRIVKKDVLCFSLKEGKIRSIRIGRENQSFN